MLIGISGKKQSGKDTIGGIIQKMDAYLHAVNFDKELSSKEEVINAMFTFGGGHSIWRKQAFANSLKECARIILNDNYFNFESNELKDTLTTIGLTNNGKRITNREFLQLLGTEVGRAIDPDIWVKSLMHWYSKFPERPNWIVTDVRFPNEAEAIKREGGLLIRVNRNTGFTDTHPSETALDDYKDFDEIIDNNGSIENLIGQVYDIMLKHKLI